MKTDDKPESKKNFSFDWLVGGVLTKLGDTFDRFTGRNWNPSSSLATSKLTEKLKFLLDSEVRELDKKGKFVPHIIKLKIQWDKFSTEAEENLDKLKHELHASAIDHINDKLYHTYAPINIEIKTDYFTEGVKMLSSFGKFSDKEDDEASINVTIPKMRVEDLLPNNQIQVNLSEEEPVNVDDCFIARFTAKNKAFEIELNFTEKKRISVGRGPDNQISINDPSVSKIHAALVLNAEKQLMVADTGSTNGTFINEKRIAYGKAVMFEDDAKLKFGTVEVTFERLEVYVEEEFIEDEQIEEIIEHSNSEEFLPTEAAVSLQKPTEAAVNLQEDERISEPLPTDASMGTIEREIPKPNLTASFEDEIVKPIEPKQVRNEQKTDVEFESEEFASQPEVSETNESKEINLDKTQDWEV